MQTNVFKILRSLEKQNYDAVCAMFSMNEKYHEVRLKSIYSPSKEVTSFSPLALAPAQQTSDLTT